MACYLIGDIQGCYDPLHALLDRIKFDPAEDRLILCGDLVNRGGQSLDVMRLLYSIRKRVTVTLGNHDIHLLAENMRYPEGGSRNREFERIFAAHDREELVRWVTRQKLAHVERDHKLLVVHAGVIPQWTLQDVISEARNIEKRLRSDKCANFLRKAYKSRKRLWRDKFKGNTRRALALHILTRIRYCDAVGQLNFGATGPPGTQPRGYLPWFKYKHRKTRDIVVAFGHWASLGLRIKKRYLALDSGCVWGGSLTALRVEDRKVYQVPGKKKK